MPHGQMWGRGAGGPWFDQGGGPAWFMPHPFGSKLYLYLINRYCDEICIL